MRRLIILVGSLLLSLSGSADEDAYNIRLSELRALGTIAGVWKGVLEVKHIPPLDSGEELHTIYLESVHKLDAHAVFLAYKKGEEPQELIGETSFFEDQLGWVVHVQRSAGFWIEKYVLMFSRESENKAYVTLTRTVHNWFIPDDASAAPKYYSMFAEGEVKREIGSE